MPAETKAIIFKQIPTRRSWASLYHEQILYLANIIYKLRSPVVASESPANAITVVCISDTHNLQRDLPAGDILLHAGDLTQKGTFQELQDQINWLDKQPHRYKIVIGGELKPPFTLMQRNVYSPISRKPRSPFRFSLR